MNNPNNYNLIQGPFCGNMVYSEEDIVRYVDHH